MPEETPRPNDRDTRFQVAATLLLERITRGESPEKREQIAAQCLWDFMYHVQANVDCIVLESSTAEHLINGIPDMTAWPEVDEELQQKIAEWIAFCKKVEADRAKKRRKPKRG